MYLYQVSDCTCAPGWEGSRCERKIDYCVNVTCYNKGLCRPLLGNYKCECLIGSYSGRHCEVVDGKVVVRQFIAKSFAYLAIIAMVSVTLFVIVYGCAENIYFGIDPAGAEVKRIRRAIHAKKPQTSHSKVCLCQCHTLIWMDNFQTETNNCVHMTWTKWLSSLLLMLFVDMYFGKWRENLSISYK